MRPDLTKEISVQHFTEFYWLKNELQAFCRENGISASGSKEEISKRVKVFLQTGEIDRPIRKTKGKNKIMLQVELNLDTIIGENHRCSQDVRTFFKSVIPKFHFSTYIQDYFNSNVGKTYRDAVEAWHAEEKRKKDPSYKTEISPQFEYNQFIRDFYADTQNIGKSRSESVQAWNDIKKLPGNNKYVPIQKD